MDRWNIKLMTTVQMNITTLTNCDQTLDPTLKEENTNGRGRGRQMDGVRCVNRVDGKVEYGDTGLNGWMDESNVCMVSNPQIYHAM